MKISYAITVCSELEEIQRLLTFLLKHKELQDEIGTVESLTTSATDLQAAINEHESDIIPAVI